MNIADVDTFWTERGFTTNNLWIWHRDTPVLTYEIRREDDCHAISIKDNTASMQGDYFADEIHGYLLSWAKHRGLLDG